MCYNQCVTKKLLPAGLASAALLAMRALPINAASYQTPLFPTSYRPQSLTWIVTNASSQDLVLEYQTKANSNDSDAWQDFNSFTCTNHDDRLTCQTDVPTLLEDYLQFRLSYPDIATLQTFNLSLTPTVTENPEASASDQIFYSNFKTLDPALTATALSWQEAALTTPPTDRIIVQTRATYDAKHWTDWSGNLTAAPLNSEASVSSDVGSVTLHEAKLAGHDIIALTYTDEHNLYTLTSPVAAAPTEAEAFNSLSFTLDSLTGLRLGDTITITETVGSDTFTTTGMIADLKASENRVTVFAWEGAIPTQSSDKCGTDNTFCFSSSAHVSRTITQLYPAPATDVTDAILPVYTNLQTETPVTYAPHVTDVSLWSYTEPSCLEYADNNTEASTGATLACETKSLPLTSYYSQGQPTQLQYRVIYGFTGDVTVTDVFLHQDTPAGLANSSNITTNQLVRLRSGKSFVEGNSRPYYWH